MMLRCALRRVGVDAGAGATRRRRGTTRATRATTRKTATAARARRNREDDDAVTTQTMPRATTTTRTRARTTRRATDAAALGAAALAATNASAASAAQLVSELALDPEGARTASAVLGPLFAVSTILFIVRIVMTWYPSVPYTKLPWVLAYAPTEPLLKPTRALVPPVGGGGRLADHLGRDD